MNVFRNMNGTLRGFLIIAAIALVVVVLNLGVALASIWLLARIAFALAIAYLVYQFWREHRSEIADMPGRVQAVLYGGAALIVVDFAVYFVRAPVGGDALAFLAVLAIAGYSMFRAWRDQRTYS